MLLRSLVVVGLVGFAILAANAAFAEGAKSFAPSYTAIEGVSFTDPAAPNQFAPVQNLAPMLDVSRYEDSGPHFAQFGPASQRADSALQNYEVALVAQRGAYGLPLDVSIAQRASIGVNAEGDIAHRGRGAEVRFGRGLARARHGRRGTWEQPAFYAFAASDNEALTWAPGGPGERNTGFALQDRIKIGNHQAGITYEAGPFQASLAYVERKISSTTGATTVYRDENFAGITLTLQH